MGKVVVQYVFETGASGELFRCTFVEINDFDKFLWMTMLLWAAQRNYSRRGE